MRDSIMDLATTNSNKVEEVVLHEFRDLYEHDEEMADTDQQRDGVEVVEP